MTTKKELHAYADSDKQALELFLSTYPVVWRAVKGFEIEDPDKYREATFIKELVTVVEMVGILTENYATRTQDIDPKYALEKLGVAKRYIETAMSFYEYKGDEQ